MSKRIGLRPDSFSLYVAALFSAFIVLLPDAATAADAVTTSPQMTNLEEIIVTAQRRQQNAQDIAVSIDSFDADRLAQSGIATMTDLQFLVPGLKAASVGGLARISLRGVGTNGLSPTAESGVAIYMDGVFLGNAFYPSRAFFDLDRVEILRGPQGSLYGRNATGGAININTKAPTATFEGGATLKYGDYDFRDAETYLSGPLVGDKLRGRLAATMQSHDGYTPNDVGPSGDDADNLAIRARLAYQPSESFSIDLGADFDRDDSVTAVTAQRAQPNAPLLFELLGGVLPTGRRIAQDADATSRIDTKGLRLTLSWNAGPVTLTSITARRDVTFDSFNDLDFTSLPFATGLSGLKSHQITQDLYAVSSGAGRLDWTIGGSYFREETGTSITLGTPIGSLRLNSPRLPTEAYAAYAEAVYRLTDSVEAIAGVRHTHERKTFTEADLFSGAFSPLNPLPFAPTLGPLRDSWTKTTPRVGLKYLPVQDVMLYATYSQGFKAGGFNSLSSQTTSFDPEDNTSYEIGIKSEFFGHRLRMNASAFRMDYDGLQVQQRIAVPASPLAVLVIANAASARIDGVEVEILAVPIQRFTVDCRVTYLDSEYLKYDAVDELAPPSSPQVVSAAGNRLNSAPEWSANLGMEYRIGVLTLRSEYAYQDRVFNNPTNADALSQGAFDRINAQIAFDSGDGHWHLAAWVQNIGDDDVYAIRSAGARDAVGGQPIVSYYLPPRTYGVTVGYRF